MLVRKNINCKCKPIERVFRDGASGELKFELEGHAMGIISVDISVDGTRK